MKTTVILVRHGETNWNRARKFQGMSDIPLNETGKMQAGCARDALADTPIDVCFCSPLDRARETAEIICQGQKSAITPTPVYDLHEQNAGKWESMTADEIIKLYPKEYDDWCNRPSKALLEGGETFQEVRDRALPAFWKIVHENVGQTILLVSHMVCLSSILDVVAGVDMDDIWAYPISNAGINYIEVETPDAAIQPGQDAATEPLDGETATVTVWNEDEHLPEEYRRKPMFLRK